MTEPLKYEHDLATDTVTIEGVKYTGAFFRLLGGLGSSPLKVGEPFRVTLRTDHGDLHLERIDPAKVLD